MAVIDITIDCADGVVRAVHIEAHTPNPAPMLVGLAAPAVAGVLGRLYAICGAAQRACAEISIAAASARPLPAERCRRLELEVAAESVQEHLWRLWLDWPALLALPVQQAPFQYWYAAIRAGQRDWPGQLTETLRREWLGRAAEDLAAFADLDVFGRWCAAGSVPAAELFAALAGEPAAAPLRSPRPAATIDTPLATTRAHVWVAALEDAGRPLEALLASRVVALTALLGALVTDPSMIDLAVTSPAPGRGLGSVGTARGWLEHDVTLDGDRVAAYSIRTPTERHFAPDGPYASYVRGQPAADGVAARRLAALWALAFDPCFSHAIAGCGHA